MREEKSSEVLMAQGELIKLLDKLLTDLLN